jgi:hypothetical protein
MLFPLLLCGVGSGMQGFSFAAIGHGRWDSRTTVPAVFFSFLPAFLTVELGGEVFYLWVYLE